MTHPTFIAYSLPSRLGHLETTPHVKFNYGSVTSKLLTEHCYFSQTVHLQALLENRPLDQLVENNTKSLSVTRRTC